MLQERDNTTDPERRRELDEQIEVRRANNRERQRRFKENNPDYFAANAEAVARDARRRRKIRNLKTLADHYNDRILLGDRPEDAQAKLDDVLAEIETLEIH